MNISVLTPNQEIFAGQVTSVKVPGVMGQFQILNNHAPIVSALEEGEVQIRTAKGEARLYNDEKGTIETALEDGHMVSFQIEKGFIEVLNNEVNLLVEGVTAMK